MKASSFTLFSILLSLILGSIIASSRALPSHRRILHQPLFPVDSTPPPVAPEPPPESSGFPNPDQPFFPEVPTGPTPDQTQTTPAPANVSTSPVPIATQPNSNPIKKVTIAISVGLVTLGMFSALIFFVYRHRTKRPVESQKLVGRNSQQLPHEPTTTSTSDFLYLGTVEPTNHRRSNGEPNGSIGSPYHKLNSVRTSELYRPSPELQPLPLLTRTIPRRNSPPAILSDDDTFYTAQVSAIGNTESPSTTTSAQAKGLIHSSGSGSGSGSTPHSRRSSPKSRLSISSPDIKHAILPSSLPPPPPPPPPPPLLRSINDPHPKVSTAPPPPPTPGKLRPSETRVSQMTVPAFPKTHFRMPNPEPKAATWADQIGSSGPAEGFNAEENPDVTKPRLKPLHWDKVRATSDRDMVWDHLKSSSFQLNEDMIETLFGFNATNQVQKEPTRKAVIATVEQENRVLDPKKSQNIAILLRALNVTREEVSEALLDGNPEGLGTELLETLVKMAPTKQEELKLRDYRGDTSKLGSAERFLKAILDIPFAFKRVDAMLYRANFDTEVKYLRKSFETLEAACGELKNSRLFLKLLEAVLRTGNRMNVGTNRGDARSFKLDTLLKLVDVKGTDGKTTVLHFVVQEIIRSEGAGSDSRPENFLDKMHPKVKEDDFKQQGLQVVAGLSRELGNVKKAAGMDSDVLNSYLSKLEMGLEKVRSVLQYEKSYPEGNFFEAIKLFLKEAEEEILRVKADEKKALSLVKEVTEYFHGDGAKEEAHPLRIFMIVKDFLSVLDQVCKEVGKIQERTMVGTARSFRIAASASLPVLNRFKNRQDRSSDEDSSSP